MLTVRIGLGGGAERQWHGDVAVTSGTLSLVRPLGILADSPASIWPSSDNQLEIRQRSPRAYDGLDVAINAPTDAKLKIRLAAEGDAEPTVFEFSLADLAVKMQRRPLDKQDNQLLLRRGPGDLLRVAHRARPTHFHSR